MRFKLFGNEMEEVEEGGEGWVEVNMEHGTAAPGRVGISVEKLNEFADTERILRSVRKGNIIFLKIKGLKEKDIGELKRAVEKLKKAIVANNGDIAGVEQEWLILTPESASVER
ncbi:MAG: cell division protein SepF [Candidatus Aenigmarchaeota archaeon]|nr:cell division protein SepF [Candidatus Aenigmarchaeota archaeon]